jgi:hypothetical protein
MGSALEIGVFLGKRFGVKDQRMRARTPVMSLASHGPSWLQLMKGSVILDLIVATNTPSPAFKSAIFALGVHPFVSSSVLNSQADTLADNTKIMVHISSEINRPIFLSSIKMVLITPKSHACKIL